MVWFSFDICFSDSGVLWEVLGCLFFVNKSMLMVKINMVKMVVKGSMLFMLIVLIFNWFKEFFLYSVFMYKFKCLVLLVLLLCKSYDFMIINIFVIVMLVINWVIS